MRTFRIRYEIDNEAFEVEAGGIPEGAEFAAGDLYGLIEGLISAIQADRFTEIDELDAEQVLELMRRDGRLDDDDYGDTGERNGRTETGSGGEGPTP